MSTELRRFVAPPLKLWRRIGAIVVAVLAVAALALAVAGVWNPWSLVVLRERAADPMVDVFVTLLLATVATWLGWPVVSEADQHRRLVLRTSLVGLTVFTGLLALLTWGLAIFKYEPSVLASSADGQRSVALVQVFHGRELHSFTGTGAGRRDMGSFGDPCGGRVTVQFSADDQIRVVTDYGAFDLRTEPATGKPTSRLGPTCSG
jgi:succinate dehydrogenase hydrophobic anchor subunit